MGRMIVAFSLALFPACSSDDDGSGQSGSGSAGNADACQFCGPELLEVRAVRCGEQDAAVTQCSNCCMSATLETACTTACEAGDCTTACAPVESTADRHQQCVDTCGNGSCEVGETEAICFADCGQALAAESMCGDGIDGDRDGLVDCFDSDCCRDTACDGFDLDGDGFALCDCNDASGVAWGVPGEATDMHVYHYGVGYTLFLWAPPADPGGSADYFDLVRSTNPSDFSAGTCIWVDPLMSNANDPEDPPAGSAFFYLSRAKNACPAVGPLGSSSSGVPHSAPSCF